MTDLPTTASAQVSNADVFRQKLGVLHIAAVAVIMVRTREPFRAIDNICNFAFAENMNCEAWTISEGWRAYNRADPNADPVVRPNTQDPLAGLRAIDTSKHNDSFFVMMYPHQPLAKNIVMIQILKEYAQKFPRTSKRVVLVVPETWSLPEELQNDIVVLDFEPPSEVERLTAYNRLVANIEPARRPNYTPADLNRILSVGAGLTRHEFVGTVAQALAEGRQLLPNLPIDSFCNTLAQAKVAAVRRSEVLDVLPAVSMDSIGGLDNLKEWVGMRRPCFTEEAKKFGIEPPKGIALIGPPGTGKSASAKAIASVLGIPLIRFDVGRVFNSLVGQSESRVRAALEMVNSMAPCVLMIDEADKAFAGQAGGTSGGDSGVGMRVLGAILTWMQETTAPVFMVVTANRVSGLPSEFLRRGRLDEIFSVTVPFAEEREQILKIHLSKRGKKPEEISDLAVAVERSNGYVAAELESAVKDALIVAFSKNIPVTGELIAEQLAHMVPLSVAFEEDFSRMREWAENNARPASIAPGENNTMPRAARPRKRVGGAAPADTDRVFGESLAGNQRAPWDS
jgi:AAA+ superfamily predicted ATPase